LCEFKVYLRKGLEEEVIAEDIVYARKSEGKLIVKNILGGQVSVENVDIVEVDVRAERLVLNKTNP
jgi:predicted RNA-binding protein